MRLLTTEGAMRAAHQAKQEGSNTVTVEHFEKVLSQLVSLFYRPKPIIMLLCIPSIRITLSIQYFL